MGLFPDGWCGPWKSGIDILVVMPNQPKTPRHAFRIDDELYRAAKEKAEQEGRSLSEVVREFLVTYTGG